MLADYICMSKKRTKNLQQPAVILAHPRMPEGAIIDWIPETFKLSRKQKKQLKKLDYPKIAILLFDQQNEIFLLGTAGGDTYTERDGNMEQTFQKAPTGDQHSG